MTPIPDIVFSQLKEVTWAGVGLAFVVWLMRMAPSMGKWLEGNVQISKATTVSKLNGTLVEAMRQAMGREAVRVAIAEYLIELPEPGRTYLRDHVTHFYNNLLSRQQLELDLGVMKKDITRIEQGVNDNERDLRQLEKEVWSRP